MFDAMLREMSCSPSTFSPHLPMLLGVSRRIDEELLEALAPHPARLAQRWRQDANGVRHSGAGTSAETTLIGLHDIDRQSNDSG